MQLVTRAEWGAKAPSADYTYVGSTLGVKIHYEGTPVSTSLAADHGLCAGHVRDIQASHMANTSEGYIDIAYSAVVCSHGYVFEGRGLHHKTAANGNSQLNWDHYAVCGMVGDSGQVQPTDAMLNGLRDAIEWFQSQGGAGSEIKGHRDGYATSCPGDVLYSWVQNGAPRPSSGTVPVQPAPTPSPSGPAWPGEYLRLQYPMIHDNNVRTWQAQMAARGWTIAVDGWYGSQSDKVCRQFQAEKNLGVDGIVGPKTWAAAWNSPVT